jgi:hypothetical protein
MGRAYTFAPVSQKGFNVLDVMARLFQLPPEPEGPWSRVPPKPVARFFRVGHKNLLIAPAAADGSLGPQPRRQNHSAWHSEPRARRKKPPRREPRGLVWPDHPQGRRCWDAGLASAGAAVAAMPGTLSVPIRHTSPLTGLPGQGRPWRFASTPIEMT